MVSSSKETVTAQELGQLLVYYDGRVAQNHADHLQQLPGVSNLDTAKISQEMMFLRIFTFDFAVAMALDSDKGGPVLDLYYALWKKALSEHDPNGDAVWAMMQERLLVYTAAVKREHHLGFPYTVGKAFAELCGHSMSATVTAFGSMLFVATFKSVSHIIESLSVV